MFAYKIPGEVVRPDGIASHPLAKRLVHAGPWQTSDCEGGTLLTWRGASVRMDAYGEPQTCGDGLVYYPARGVVTPADLAKPSIPESVSVTLASGVTLSIPLAQRSARVRSFVGARKVGDYLSEFPRVAFRLYDRVHADEAITLDDADLVRCVFLAVATCYRVTEEVLSDLGWLSTADDNPITSAVFGLSPKAHAAAGSI